MGILNKAKKAIEKRSADNKSIQELLDEAVDKKQFCLDIITMNKVEQPDILLKDGEVCLFKTFGAIGKKRSRTTSVKDAIELYESSKSRMVFMEPSEVKRFLELSSILAVCRNYGVDEIK